MAARAGMGVAGLAPDGAVMLFDASDRKESAA
jgi:hypothetical protein